MGLNLESEIIRDNTSLLKKTVNFSLSSLFTGLQLSILGAGSYMLGIYTSTVSEIPINNSFEAAYYGCIVPLSMMTLTLTTMITNKRLFG